MKRANYGYLQLISASFLTGFIPILVRYGKNIGPYNLTFFKVLFIALSIYIFSLFYKKWKISSFKYEKGKMLLFGAIHGFIFLGYFIALTYLPIATAVLLLYSGPIWMVIFSYLILKEKVNPKALFSLLIAVIGVVIILFPSKSLNGSSLIGIIAALLAGIGFGLVYVLSKTFKKYDKISLTFWQNLIAIPFTLPLLFIDPPHLVFGDFWLIITISVVCGTIPFILIYKGLAKVSAQVASSIVMLDIIFPVIFAYFFFKEIPSLLTIFGGILIILGSYFATQSQ